MSPFLPKAIITGSHNRRRFRDSSQSPRRPGVPMVWRSFPSGLIFLALAIEVSSTQMLSSASIAMPCALITGPVTLSGRDLSSLPSLLNWNSLGLPGGVRWNTQRLPFESKATAGVPPVPGGSVKGNS